MSFNFNEVQETETVKLPVMLEKDVFKNQAIMIDPIKLKALTVLVIGAGSVGSNLVHTMNKFGFSSFQIYDYDIWESHNSASSIYPFKQTNDQVKMVTRSYDDWYFYPMDYCEENGDIQPPPYSLFKVDLLEKEIRRNDPNIYFEKYRLPFGEHLTNAFTKFNHSVNKMGARERFRNDGTIRRGGSLTFDWTPKLRPDIMVLTTDSLQSRAKAVWNMRTMLKDNIFEEEEEITTFPVIDIRTLDTTKGEILVFDLLNDNEVFDWFNYSIPVSKREEDFESLEEKIDSLEVIDEIPFFEGTPNVCGNKMSIIISNQVGLMATNLIVNIFNEKTVFEDIPRLYLFNTNPLMPYVSKMEKLLNE